VIDVREDKPEDTPQRRRRPRARWLWLAVPAVLVVAGAAIAALALRDPARPVSVDDAVARYRAAGDTGSGGVAAPGLDAVPSGVYRYATQGSEGVDVLHGSSHTFPAVTTVTVSPAGRHCLATRWDALAQRWDSEVLCPGPGGAWGLTHLVQFHSFFRQDEERFSTCDAPGYVPAGSDRGTTRFTCHSPRSSNGGANDQAGTRRVIGIASVPVAGVARPAVHVRYTARVTGANAGSWTLDRWYSLDRFPLVLRTDYREATASHTAIGTVHYHESYRTALAAWEPRR
jgi:hypothetical protein